ncbi:MAG: hypothetical protein ACPGQL_08485 [Thermoplasmatota archaeon]
MDPRRAVLAALVIAPLLLVGCTGAPPEPPEGPTETGPDRSLPPPSQQEPTWWHWPGVQCEETPWRAWVRELDGTEAPGGETEAFERSPGQEAEMRRYFDDHAFLYDHAWAYRDDAVYDAACGSPDGWHYWTYTGDVFPLEDEGWTEAPEGPPAAVEGDGA